MTVKFDIKTKNECRFDAVSLGEIMLRLDPGDMRIRNTRSFRVWEGGGEYNVIKALSKCFGMNTAAVTALADNEVGRLIEDFMLQGGVDTSLVKWCEYDGIGKNVRNGLNFTEKGFGVRSSFGVYDRGNTAASKIDVGDIDWDYIFGELGVRWFHTGGVFASLSLSTADVVLEAVKAAKKYGTIVSYDFNYRPSLWKNIGGKERASEINKKIVPYVDVLIGGKDDLVDLLGVQAEDRNNIASVFEETSKAYPKLKVIVSTVRKVKSANVNDWSAVCLSDGEMYEGLKLENLEIYDRIGGGDAFASGLIYGLMTSGDVKQALDYGVAHGALAMTTPGDTTMASLAEVKAIMNGADAAVRR